MCPGGGVTPNRYHPARRTCIGSLPSGRTSAARTVWNACAPAHSRQSDRRGRSAQCPNHGRLSAVPLGLPSTTSAGSCLPLFGASSVLRPHPTSHPRTCSACGYCLPEPARHKCRARVRPPRFRAKNFPTCTRSPTARGSSMQASTPWKMLPSLQQYEIGTSELDPFRSSILGPWSPL
jgi:hypothetical protein